MNRDFDEEKASKRKNDYINYGVDSPEDFKCQNSETEESSAQEEPYCRWLDDFGWL